MKRMAICMILAGLCTLLLLFSLQDCRPAHGQLILTNLKVKIVQVQRKDNRLQVRVHEGGNRDIQYIDIDGNTKFSRWGRIISYDQAWSMFRKDMIIRVKGGYTMGLHVKAKQIWW